MKTTKLYKKLHEKPLQEWLRATPTLTPLRSPHPSVGMYGWDAGETSNPPKLLREKNRFWDELGLDRLC